MTWQLFLFGYSVLLPKTAPPPSLTNGSSSGAWQYRCFAVKRVGENVG